MPLASAATLVVGNKGEATVSLIERILGTYGTRASC